MDKDTTKFYCDRLKACYAHLRRLKGVVLVDHGINTLEIMDTYLELLKMPYDLDTPAQQVRWALLIGKTEQLLEAEYFEWVNDRAWHRKDVQAFLHSWAFGWRYTWDVFGDDLRAYVTRFNLRACYAKDADDEAYFEAWQRYIEYAQAYGEPEAAQRILDTVFSVEFA